MPDSARVPKDFGHISLPGPPGLLCYTGAVNFERVLELLRALEQEGVEYVLVGGVAVNLHGLARNTEDIDLFVRPTEANIVRLRKALRAVWDDPAIDEVTAQGLTGPYPVIRYGTPDETIVVDVIGRLGEAFQFDDLEAETQHWEGVRIPLATPGMLYRMKRDTLRPLDRIDADRLQRKFNLEK